MISDGQFAKFEHVLKSKDFKNIYKKGSCHRAGAVVLYCLPNKLEHSRLGFSIGSRFVKKASRRNRIRRIFKEIYRKSKKDLKRGIDLVLVVKTDFGAKVSYEILRDIFTKLARSARLSS